MRRERALLVQLTEDEYQLLLKEKGDLSWRQWMLTKALKSSKKIIDERLDALVEYETVGARNG